jgi:propionyl-CoA carboxylase alpha chain
VTELITGIDLVEQMILVAAGEPLDLDQARVRLKGWAVETRIYAEDPVRDFVPSTGRLTSYQPPVTGRRGDRVVRVDSGVIEGGEISIHYDPMIAKLVTYAPDRAGAIAAQADALDGFVLEGIRHNIPFLASLMAQPRWREGRLSTRFIAEEYPGGFVPPEPEGEMARGFVAVALAIDQALDRRRAAISGRTRPHPVYKGLRTVLLGKARYDVEVGVGDELAVTFEDGARTHVSSEWTPAERVWAGMVGGCPTIVAARPVLNGYDLSHGGFTARARVMTARQAELAALMLERAESDDQKVLLCPMPGLVKAINVAVGQAVKAGEALCLVEAMKMENVLRAERDVTVKSIEAKEGDSLAVDAPIMTFA